MNKFEIINDKWIRFPARPAPEIRFGDWIHICKIEAISQIEYRVHTSSYVISIRNPGGFIDIDYNQSEQELSKNDFLFLEKLLCNT